MIPALPPTSLRARLAAKRAAFAKSDAASTSLSGIGITAISVAAVIVGAVVALTLVANLLPEYTGAAADISENLTTADWGDDTANAISPTFAMLAALGALFGIIGLIFAAFHLSKRNK